MHASEVGQRPDYKFHDVKVGDYLCSRRTSEQSIGHDICEELREIRHLKKGKVACTRFHQNT